MTVSQGQRRFSREAGALQCRTGSGSGTLAAGCRKSSDGVPNLNPDSPKPYQDMCARSRLRTHPPAAAPSPAPWLSRTRFPCNSLGMILHPLIHTCAQDCDSPASSGTQSCTLGGAAVASPPPASDAATAATDLPVRHSVGSQSSGMSNGMLSM